MTTTLTPEVLMSRLHVLALELEAVAERLDAANSTTNNKKGTTNV